MTGWEALFCTLFHPFFFAFSALFAVKGLWLYSSASSTVRNWRAVA